MRRGVGVQLKEEKHGLERIHKKYKVFELATWYGQKKTHNQKMWPFNLNLTYFEDFF